MNTNKVVMAGAGVMGASLAQVYALAGYETYVYDILEAGIEKGKHLIAINQEMMVKEGLVTAEESRAAMDRMVFTLDKECFRDCRLVVESTVERMDIKQGFFREISEIAPREALLATNTSGLHITEIAEACKYPERFMGQHWLNPPHLLPLCEIIAGERTSQENLQQMRELVVGLGKQPVIVKDINGFYNDSSEVKVSLPNDDKLSSLNLVLNNVRNKYIIDLLNEKRDQVIRSFIVEQDTALLFPYIKAGKYSIRITEDLNRNGLVDTGNLLEGKQPEKVKFYKLEDGNTLIDIPEMMELEQEIDIEALFK